MEAGKDVGGNSEAGRDWPLKKSPTEVASHRTPKRHLLAKGSAQLVAIGL